MQHQTKPWRKWARRIGRAIGALLALLLLVIGYLHTPMGQERIRALVERKLAARANGQVRLTELRFRLFGEIVVGGLSIKDERGDEAISLKELRVAPAWGKLLRGNVVLDRVAVSGVRVHGVKDAAGNSSLATLFKPSPPTPPAKEPAEPSKRAIELKQLDVNDVEVVIDQPDGSRLRVADLDIDARIRATPGEKTFAIEVPRFGVSLGIDKGEGLTKAGIRGLSTGLTVAMDHGKGTATVHPTTATIVVTPPGKAEKTIPFALEAVTVDVDEGRLKGSLEGLVAGALALTSVEVAADKDQEGARRGDALGLRLDAKKLNELLDRDVVASDVDVDLHVDGKGEDLTVVAKARTNGGKLTIDGKIGADPASPAYDVTLDLDEIDTKKLLVEGATAVPPIEVGHARVTVKGKGTTTATAKADAKIRIERVKARGVPIESVAIDAHVDHGGVNVESVNVDTLGQHARVSGDIDLEKKTIDVSLAVDGDAGTAIARLRAAGVPVTAKLPPGVVVLKKGDLTVHAKGRLDGAIDVDVNAPRLTALGGGIGVSAHAVVEKNEGAPDGKKVSVHDIDATVTLSNVPLSSIAALRGKQLPIDGAISGKLGVRGAANAPDATFALKVDDVRAGLVPIDVKVGLEGRANAQGAHVALTANRGADGEKLLAATADVPLAGKALDPNRPLSIKVDVPRRTFGDLVNLAWLPGFVKRKIPEGELALAVDVHGTAARPDGKVDLDVRGRFLADKEQRVHLAGVLGSEGGAARGDLDVSAWLDDEKAQSLAGKIAVSAPQASRAGLEKLAWNADIDLEPMRFDSIPLPPERAAKLRALGGEARGHVALHGTMSDALGDIRIEARDLRPNGAGPIAMTAKIALGESDTTVDVGVDLVNTPLLTARGKAALGGRDLVTKVRNKTPLDPTLDVAVDIPERPLSSLSSLRPALAALPGVLAGHIAVSGTLKTPLAKGRVAAERLETIDGRSGAVALDLDAGAETLAGSIRIGAATGDRVIRIDARASRAELARFRSEGAPLPVEASLRADALDIRSIAPKAALGDRWAGLQGRLDADLALHATLAKKDDATALASGEVVGKLDFSNGVVPLPRSQRSYKNVRLHIESDAEAIRAIELAATESDLENKQRTLSLKGSVGLESLHPNRAELDIRADKWLLFGKSLGQPDAPRGTLSVDAHLDGDLEGALKKLAVKVKKLELLIPDRFDKAHQPEDVHVGDIAFVGDPGTRIGKLPVPEAVLARAAQTATALEPTQGDDDEERGLDATIQLDDARVLQSPIDLSPRGALTVRVRPSGRSVRGKLVMTKGELSLGGKVHPLKNGSLVFDEKHPEGWMDLTFTRKVPPAAMAEVSEASAGDAISIHMFGPISDRKTVLSGAGSPGTLYDLLAMHNAGHVRYMSEPGMPASNTAQFPQLDNVLALSFISVNLPHLLFLDRVGAWANTYDDQKSYGRLEHYEAERYAADGKVLVRATNQPPKIGASQSELELDYLLQSTNRSRFGIGVGGGSRGGGGPGVFWEWSSRE